MKPKLPFGEEAIESFSHEYHFLSNFYCEYPYLFEYIGIKFISSEHAYQYMKCADDDGRNAILSCRTPGQAKRMGKKVIAKEGWDNIKVDEMRSILTAKFKIPELSIMLLGTGYKKLIEGNNWGDKFWGVCDGVGKNMLGEILMEIRHNIRYGKQ